MNHYQNICKMRNIKKLSSVVLIMFAFSLVGCKVPQIAEHSATYTQPGAYVMGKDSTNSAEINYQQFFNDPYLANLIDSALANNQELNIVKQEISIAKNEVLAKKGAYLPFLRYGAGLGMDKVGRYTRNGALEANNEIAPGKEFPEPLTDLMVGANFSWELDVWRKLRNDRQASFNRYLASTEGKNFLVTNLVSEIAQSYYELLGMDNQLEIINQYIAIQKNALKIVKFQKESARVTELAVKRFEAELFKNQSRIFEIKQNIIEVENRINYLVGRFPQPIQRARTPLLNSKPWVIQEGLPAQLLQNRPDIRQAELEMIASKIDVQVARAEFLPSFGLNAGLGIQSFSPKYFFNLPASIIYSLVGDMVGPLVNKNEINANFYSKNAKQLQAITNYQQKILNAHREVYNQLKNIENMQLKFDAIDNQVNILGTSIKISTNLFQSARADYMEVLLTQRDALEAKIELVETKKEQYLALIGLYHSLGGGWR
ncbi:MAG: hypothetical protein RIR51_1342 [Bacteroidota bacterium]